MVIQRVERKGEATVRSNDLVRRGGCLELWGLLEPLIPVTLRNSWRVGERGRRMG